MSAPYMIRSAALTGFEEVARPLGLNPVGLLREVGIDPACLADPDRKIPVDAIRRLYELAALETGVENFGLRMAEPRNLSNLGPIGLLAREEPTVRQALETIIRRDVTMGDKVRHLVRVLMPSGRCTIEQVARHLGVDRRTVHRQLAQTGDTFSSITTEIRRELADRYVGSGERCLSDVSELLGFSALSGFSRWFHQHYGCSPTAWRKAQIAADCSSDQALR